VIGTLRRLVALTGVGPGRVTLSILLGSLTVLCAVGLMATAGYLISRAAEQPAILSLTVAIVAVRFFGLARPLARYLERLASHDLALRALATIRSGFYRRIEPLAPAELEGYRSGELLARMVGDVDDLQGLYLKGLGPPLVALVTGAACVGVTAGFLPVAALVLAAGLLAGGLAVPAAVGALARRAGRRHSAARAELTAELVEFLRGAPELVAFGAQQGALARVRSADRELARLGRRDALAAGVGDSLSILVMGTTVTGVLAVAVAAHAGGTLDRVLVATLALIALASFESVASLPGVAQALTTTAAAGRRVLELMDREPAVRDPRDPLPAPRAGATVALEGVTARYGAPDPPVLRGADLVLSPGRRVALVGPSGSGKTTVASLLLRFLDPEEGRVTLDGHDLREFRQDDARRMFAVAGQDAHLFNTTIRANLLLARGDASTEELDDALRRARIADWVASLPDGLDTQVGEEGAGVSGGQRQRLVLARALLADAPVLILDEPTSHLDDPTAERLIDDVLDASADRALLLITHRPQGLDRMDEIVSLVEGRTIPMQ
jgi:ATP-binding cassette, subfamily C, bacterial CydC